LCTLRQITMIELFLKISPQTKFFAFHLYLQVLVCRRFHTLHNKNKIWQFKKMHSDQSFIIQACILSLLSTSMSIWHRKDSTNHENSKNHTSFKTCTVAQKKLKIKQVKLNTHGCLMSPQVCTRTFMRC
jgi:hypothetical protein